MEHAKVELNRPMKKFILRLVIALVILIALAVLAISLFLDRAIKSGVEVVGSKLTQVDLTLKSVRLSLLSGGGEINGLALGNPTGYKTPQAILVGSASLQLKPASLLSDKVVIRSIKVESPEITFEGGVGGNNLSTILANVKSATASSGGETSAPAEQGASKKLQVDEFIITGAKLNVNITGLGGGKQMLVTLPDIRLADLGTGPEGITAGELTQKVLSRVLEEAVKGSDQVVANVGKNVSNLVNEVKLGGTNTVDSVGKSLNTLFKK